MHWDLCETRDELWVLGETDVMGMLKALGKTGFMVGCALGRTWGSM